MKSLSVAIVFVLVCSSTASGGWHHGVWMPVPAPVVVPSYAYYPPPPVYVYRTPALMPPVVAPHYVGYPPAAVVPSPVVVYPKVFYPGQPVRNVLRAVLP